MAIERKLGDGTVVRFTLKKLLDFKAARDAAVKDGKTGFEWDGHQFNTVYAKYLIEYVEGELRRG